MNIFKTLTIILLSIIAVVTPVAAQDDYWTAVQQDYQNRTDIPLYVRELMDNTGVWSLDFEKIDGDLAKYLTFLYAYMPMSDLADYDFYFFKDQVKVALEARETFSWGKTIPDDIFRHFVVVYRVNNENLDTARSYIFHQLKNRIKNMSMYDAALEVNHWCHEYVDYQPADVRSSAPLATLKTSHGRCGEESTLTVTALRAVGIPARQCYTPRWAHCDDNHAWVEVWVDGKWWFLGACEPAPALNMGWFAVPATRTMMVHTNVFGRYEGPEEVNKKTKYYSCINVLSNYADTVRMTVTVVDGNHQPIKDALVRFKLYNYAEYYTLAAKSTDENGQASLVTGKGDLLIWVTKDDMYGYDLIDGRTEKEGTIMLLPNYIMPHLLSMNAEYSDDFTIKPPVGNPDIPAPDPARQARCDRRKQYEDSLREAYRATFPTDAWVKANLKSEYFTDEELYDIVRRSEGNYAEIIKFLQKHSKKEEGLYLKEFVNALADKDLRDTEGDLLETLLRYHYGYGYDKYPKDIFIKGILSPRISNELLRYGDATLFKEPYDVLGAKPTVAQMHQYALDSIVVDPECNYYNCPISPSGVCWLKRTDAHSRDIFFVALCREHQVPAYMDNSNGDIFAWENGKWNLVTFEEKPVEDYKTLILRNPNKMGYYTQYTLQRFENGEFVSFDFENDPRVEANPIVLSVPAGYYCLSLGNRQPDGSVLSQMQFFNITKDTTVRDIRWEENQDVVVFAHARESAGTINMEKTKVGSVSLADILKKCGKERLILCLGSPGSEPVNHLMKEMAAKQEGYETWNGPMFFVKKEGQWKSEPKQPKNLNVVEEGYDELVAIFKKALNGELSEWSPMCFVIDRDGHIVYFSEGYNIGVGDLLLESVNKVKTDTKH